MWDKKLEESIDASKVTGFSLTGDHKRQRLPVLEIQNKSAAEFLFDDLPGFWPKISLGRVSHGESDNSAHRKGAKQLGEPLAVVAGIVRVVAFWEQQSGRVRVHHAQVDASAEVSLEGITPRGHPRRRDASG